MGISLTPDERLVILALNAGHPTLAPAACVHGDRARRARAAPAPPPPVGRQVQLKQSRRLSKRKSHIVTAILQKEDGSAPPSPFPSVIP